MDGFFFYAITTGMVLASTYNMLQSFVMYYDLHVLAIINVVVRVISLTAMLSGCFRWIYLVRSRQNFAKFRVDRLNTEEFSFFMYSAPTVMLSPLPMVWRAIMGDEWSKAHIIEIIIFDMSVRYVLFAFILRKISISTLEHYNLLKYIYSEHAVLYIYFHTYSFVCYK